MRFVLVTMMLVASSCSAQTAVASAPQNTPDAPIAMTLQDAISRAKKNEPQFRAAQTEVVVFDAFRYQHLLMPLRD